MEQLQRDGREEWQVGRQLSRAYGARGIGECVMASDGNL